MRLRLALLAAVVGGITLVGAAGAATAAPAIGAEVRVAPVARLPVPRARLRRQRPGGRGARRAQRRRAGERPSRHGRPRRPAGRQRAAGSASCSRSTRARA